jgi:membrane fusion protein, heavy metal efflux system
MFAQAAIRPAVIDEASTVLAIPEEAIQTVEGGPAVFVPVEGELNTFAKRSVTVGPPVAGMVQVLSGLRDGETLIVAGSFILKAELGKAGAAHEH